MNNWLLKTLIGMIAFFIAYIGVYFLINNRIDWIMTLSMTLGYGLGSGFINYKYNKKGK